jgi:hypothetical protein
VLAIDRRWCSTNGLNPEFVVAFHPRSRQPLLDKYLVKGLSQVLLLLPRISNQFGNSTLARYSY